LGFRVEVVVDAALVKGEGTADDDLGLVKLKARLPVDAKVGPYTDPIST